MLAGGWSSDTIVEDTDLGLTMLEHGWQIALHQPPLRPRPAARHLRGLQEAAPPLGLWRLPDPARSTGATCCPRARGLTREQKREFALGWLNWLGAESIGVAVAILNLVWVPVVAFAGIAIPDKILTIPILAAFVVSLAPLRRALPAARRDPARPDDRRGVRRHVGAVDGGARGRLRRLEGKPAVHAHRQGRHDPQGPGLPGVLGGGAGARCC